MKNRINSICLIGMPGAGKTAVARELSNIFKIPSFDADREIETAARRKIVDIFNDFGEKNFRDGETKVINRLLSMDNCILSTGAGAYINETTRKVIKDKSISVWIDVNINTLWNRVKDKPHRPLLQGKDGRKKLEKMFAERTPIYANADIVINYKKSSPKSVAKIIAKKIKEYQNADTITQKDYVNV